MSSWREWTAGRPMQGAIGAFLIALLLLAMASAKAFRVSEVVAAPSTVNIVAGALDTPEPMARIDVASAVDVDVFSPERTPATKRYRMPGEPDPVAPPPEPPHPIVLGTAIAADGSSFATCQLESSRLLMVRVGDTIGGFTVKTITRGRVVFANAAGKSFEVLAPRAGS